jgi:hypothetical protein
MAHYMFAYSGGSGVAANEAERDAQMAKWRQWVGQLGPAFVDVGAPTGTAKTVGTGGSVSDGGSRGLTGYSIVAADSLDALSSSQRDVRSSRLVGQSMSTKRSRCSTHPAERTGSARTSDATRPGAPRDPGSPRWRWAAPRSPKSKSPTATRAAWSRRRPSRPLTRR